MSTFIFLQQLLDAYEIICAEEHNKFPDLLTFVTRKFPTIKLAEVVRNRFAQDEITLFYSCTKMFNSHNENCKSSKLACIGRNSRTC